MLPEVKILVGSGYPDPDFERGALGNGVNGYLLKMDAGVELLPAIEAVLRGEKFVSSSVKLLDPLSAF
jgi:DNA-binding NarL/FixJ family response regulator